MFLIETYHGIGGESYGDIIEEMKSEAAFFEYIDEKFYILSRNVDFNRAMNLSYDAGEFSYETLLREAIKHRKLIIPSRRASCFFQ